MSEVEIDKDQARLVFMGKAVDLTATEFRLAVYLASQPGRLFDRDQIATRLYGNCAVHMETVNGVVKKLRRKAELIGCHPIGTRYGFGYFWRNDDDLSKPLVKDRIYSHWSRDGAAQEGTEA